MAEDKGGPTLISVEVGPDVGPNQVAYHERNDLHPEDPKTGEHEVFIFEGKEGGPWKVALTAGVREALRQGRLERAGEGRSAKKEEDAPAEEAKADAAKPAGAKANS